MSELAQTILRTDSTGLVIVRAGKRSLHPGWVSPEASPKFDLLVTAYEDGVPGAESGNIARIDVPGPKIAGFRRIFAEHPELLDKYEYIALIDDDIAVTQQQIEETFAIGRQYGLSIFQPSLTWNSYYSYAGFLQQSRRLVCLGLVLHQQVRLGPQPARYAQVERHPLRIAAVRNS